MAFRIERRCGFAYDQRHSVDGGLVGIADDQWLNGARDLTSVVGDLQKTVAKDVNVSPGVSIAYTGQLEFLQRAIARLKIVVPATQLIIFVLLYVTFGRFDEAALIMATLPFALTGGVWALYLLGFHQSVAPGASSSPWRGSRPSSAW
jgi:Cu/Ag efflux pump CusA